ncbi:hypothetical protein Tco_0125335, partial [Tanacetum coccineum]
MPEDPYAYVVAAFQAPPSLDYVSGPEYPPSPEFIPEPVYPDFMPPKDDVLPSKEKQDDDDEDESSDDDEDEDVNIKGDKEEEEHPAPADSTAVALPAIDQASSAKETEPFETDESTATPLPYLAYRVTARISVQDMRKIMRDLERDVGYRITNTWDGMPVDMSGAPTTDDKEMGQRMTEFTTRVRQDTYEIYTRLDDEQS